MCGIVAYIGNNTKEKIINSLKKLEYRGYDSCGIAYFDKDDIKTKKVSGKILELEKELNSIDVFSPCIAHTRWATHGKPSVDNAHPHHSNNNMWFVVHNGIIENYSQLKNEELNGFNFYSQTDTETIPNLCSLFGNNLVAFYKAVSLLEGSFAIAGINKNEKKIYLSKKNAPLFVCKHNDEIICSSDIICFEKGSEYFELKDGEFAEILDNRKIIFYDKNLNEIKKKSMTIKQDIQDANLDTFEHHTIKEIFETPKIYDKLIKKYKNSSELSNLDKLEFNKIKLIGCGSAYHTALVGAMYLEQKLKIETNCYIASEFKYSNPIIDSKTLCIFISQSGETADTLACVDLVKNHHGLIVSITNTTRSSLARKSKIVLDMQAGIEIGVATTKAFNAGVIVLYILANYLKNKKIPFSNIKKLKAETENILGSLDKIKHIALLLKNVEKAFFIGRNIDYMIAQEGCLKLKEISYINCSSFPSGELKHGTLALIEKGVYCFAISTNKDLQLKNFSNFQEIVARQGEIIYIGSNNIPPFETNNKLLFNHISADLDVLLAVTIMQLIAYYTTINKGYNPDQPRNLAKSVTVEWIFSNIDRSINRSFE